jgi:hypothetical protein
MTRAEKERRAEVARALAALRETYGGGRPKKLRECPHCGAKMGARELRAHECPALRSA